MHHLVGWKCYCSLRFSSFPEILVSTFFFMMVAYLKLKKMPLNMLHLGINIICILINIVF